MCCCARAHTVPLPHSISQPSVAQPTPLSFPTRRSSDLTRMDCDIITGGGPGLMQAANEGAKAADPDAAQRSVGIRVELPFEQDRKSTRLNSSHSQISYAVFCLNKKK